MSFVQGCQIFFEDDPEMLRRSLTSLRQHCDYILAIDGPYKDFPHDKCYSTNGCIEVAQELADKVVVNKRWPWKSQCEKRNAYLNRPGLDNYYLILDTDEYLEGNWTRTGLTKDTYAIKLYDQQQDNSRKYYEWQIRIVKAFDDLVYKEKHSWLWHGNHILTQNIYNQVFDEIPTLSLIHDKIHRSDARKKDKEKHYAFRHEGIDLPAGLTVLAKHPEEYERKITLKVFHDYYGFEIDNTTLDVKANTRIQVTARKAEQLLTDFPKWFEMENTNELT